jgi:hypothetical protein
MRPHATLWERFEGWFCQPIEKLKECPEGDGGFLAMAAGLFLCERYYRTVTNTHEGQQDSSTFLDAAARDLGVDPDRFRIFWKVYRHGIQHQGMPKRFKQNGITYLWHIDTAFPATPTFQTVNATVQEILLDPWKFADLIRRKYQENPNVLDKATMHAFGEVTEGTHGDPAHGKGGG